MEGVAVQCMHMGMGWGEWASQVEHSSTREQGCMCVCTSIRACSAVRNGSSNYGSRAIWRSDGVPWPWKGWPWSACTWRWGGVSGQIKWSTQVQEIRVGCMDGYTLYASIRARSTVRIAVRVQYGGVMVCHGHGGGGRAVHAHGDGVG